MLTPELLNYILGIFALGSIAFGIWSKIKNPQINSEKVDALLQQRMQWTTESNDRKFAEIQSDITKAFELAFNHSNEALAGVKELTVVINAMGKELTKVGTILEERLPRK